MLEGFKTCADDYITKPFDSEVLLYKLRAILNRRGRDDANIPNEFEIGSFHFNFLIRTLTRKDETIQLTPKESGLLKLLCTSKNGILLRKDALEKIWGSDNYFNGRSMDVFIARLRKYLKADPDIEIVNIHGNGFRLMTNDECNE